MELLFFLNVDPKTYLHEERTTSLSHAIYLLYELSSYYKKLFHFCYKIGRIFFYKMNFSVFA